MRELVFALKDAPDTNAVANILAGNPETTIRSRSCHVTSDNLWRVDHVSGNEDALNALTETVANAEYYTDCLARPIVRPTGRHGYSTRSTTCSSSTPTGC